MIVIPMAGASRRFAEAGYARPKYELLLDGRTVFDHAVGGFEALIASEPFLFVVAAAEAAAFVEARAAALGVAHAQVVSLDAPTSGQAETVSVIGLMMMLLVFLFRWVQLRLIKRYISNL